jgi:hypothetical protein
MKDLKKKYLVSNEYWTFIYQPNRVTNAKYKFTLLQEKIFNTVIFFLQEDILKRMNGEDYTQLTLFKENNSASIILDIPLSLISKSPQQYSQIKDSLTEMVGIVVFIPYRDQNNSEQKIRIAGLFDVDLDNEYKRTSKIRIIMDKIVARQLIDIDLNREKRPVNFTKFVYQITQSSKNKYAPRIYKMICSWKNRGVYLISIEDFRSWLGIEDKYPYYRDIKKYILKPVQQELYQRADCWFDCESNDFAITKNKKLTHLKFRIFTQQDLQMLEMHKDNIKGLLRMHFSFSDDEISKVVPLLNDQDKIPGILQKIIDLKEYISKNRAGIVNPTNYVLKVLLKDYG